MRETTTNLLTRSEIEEITFHAGDHPALTKLLAHIRELHEVCRAPYRDSILPHYMAADILNVPQSYLLQLTDANKIPHERTGSYVYITYEDLYAYKARRDQERREALDELTRTAYEEGWYFDD